MARSGTLKLILSLLCVISFADATQLWATQIRLPEAKTSESAGLRIKKSSTTHEIASVVPEVLAEEEDEHDFSPAKLPTSEFRLIVKAKVNKVMAWLNEHTEEYNSADAERKNELEHQAKQEVMHHSGTRGFSKEYCMQLFRESTEFASQMTYYFCPDISFPATDGKGGGPGDKGAGEWVKRVARQTPSPIRSAYLSQYFWLAVIRNHPESKNMLAENVEYWNGHLYRGKKDVAMIIPVIGFPSYTQLAEPEEWQCSTHACLVPITAWAHTKCKAYARFNPAGLVSVVHIPMGCWR